MSMRLCLRKKGNADTISRTTDKRGAVAVFRLGKVRE